MHIETIADMGCHCGENPLWHAHEQCLYWTDIPTGRLFRFNPLTHKTETVYEGRPVGGFTIQEDGQLLLFRNRGNVVTFDHGSITRTVVSEIPDDMDTRFNDVIADARGAVFAGTMPSGSHAGRLYRINHDRSYDIVLDGIGIANGLGFSPDCRAMYFTDTTANVIYAFDYDPDTSELTHQRVHIDTHEIAGSPDGLTVDANGHIWSALWGGSGINHYDADGQFIEKIDLPTPNITSLTFAPNLDEPARDPRLADMYITSASGHERHKYGELAGATFRIANVGNGKPEFRSSINASN